MTKKKVKGLLKMLLMVGGMSGVISAGTVQAEAVYDQAPQLSGTNWIQIKQGERFDEKDILSRVYAMDYEDGDLTQEIKVAFNNINTEVCGEYMMKYSVTDTAGNTATMEAEVSVVEGYGESGQQISRRLYTKESANHLLNAGVYRGYYHDRQHLGIYLPKETNVWVRVENAEEFFQSFKENLMIDLFADDSSMETSYAIPKDGSWLRIEAANDYVPFVRTPQSEVAPILTCCISEGVEPLTYYHYGDDQKAFSEQWSENEHKFAVLDSERITMLVPRKDIGVLPGEPTAVQNNLFHSLDEMLLFYINMQKQYDDFIGVSYQAEELIDKNVRGKYFLKADAHGVGAAYYSGTMYIAQNADTIRGYLGEDYWMSLHEVAHGYDGDFTQGDLEMGEMINNILAHYYERTIDQAAWEMGGNGWSYLQNLSLIEEYYQQLIDDQTTYSEMSFDARLYFFLNILNKTDAEKMMANLHKEWRRNEGASVKEFVVEKFCEESGYNLIPYFESVGIYVNDLLKSQIYEKNDPVLTPLSRSFATKEDAQEAQRMLNGTETRPSNLVVNGRFGLVSNDELSGLKLNGKIKIQVQIDDLKIIKGQQAILLDGEKEIASAEVEAEQVIFENVPIGEYRLKFPTVKGAGYYTEYQTVKVVYGTETEYTVVYHKADGNLLKNDATIQLLGIADQLIAELVTDIDCGEITIYNKSIQPHYYFADVYTSINVLNEEENRQLYYREFIGNQNYAADEITVDAPVGSVIEIYHKEIDIRMKVVSGTTKLEYEAYTEDMTPYRMNVKYRITENGLKRIEWDEQTYEQKRVEFFGKYAKELEKNMGIDAAKDTSAYQKQKIQLISVIQTFSKEEQQKFQKLYPYLFEKKDVTKVFDDIYDEWYKEYVQYVYDNELMKGISGTRNFAPNEKITKAQVAQVLYNIEKQPNVSNRKVFDELKDVYENQWYSDAVAWAYSAGVIKGDTSVKKFFPNEDVTREQLALMMYRYAACKEYDLAVYGDWGNIQNVEATSEWALNGVKWAVDKGLIGGININGIKDLAPQGDATRAQMAAILQRFCENVK